ncbi:uncharacterized protein LOC120340118 [Styela clava]
MWRIFNGLSRGLRTRTPAPPSQTSSLPEDNENVSRARIVDNEDRDGRSEQSFPFSQLSDYSISPEAKITQRILGTPSEADLLLREFFGPSWKNKNASSNGQRQNNNGECRDIPEHIWNGVGLGTAWMTALVLGRAVLSNWNRRCKRPQSQISFDESITTWQEFEYRYLDNVHDRLRTFGIQCLNLELHQRRRMPMILHVLPSAISRNPILAAGGDSNTDIQASNEKSFRIKAVGNVPKVDLIDTPPKQKSVSFHENVWDTSDDDSASSSQNNTDDSRSELSEEAVERFVEDTKDCSGATYNILALQSLHVGDYKEAFQRFQLGSNEGYAKSHFNLALCYEKGVGTRKNFEKAMELYEKAAFKGHTKAQYNLALRLLDKGGSSRVVHAIGLLEKAALNGFTQAQSFLGAHLTKPGEFQDFKKAVKMFKMAAEGGDTNSKYHLGICYERGLGSLKKDLNKAFDLYSSAASSDHLCAQYNMAMMLEAGFSGMEKNTKVAEDLLKSAAKLGHRPSALRLKEIEKSKTRSTKTHNAIRDSNQAYKMYYSQGTPSNNRVKTRVENSYASDSNHTIIPKDDRISFTLTGTDVLQSGVPSTQSYSNVNILDHSAIFSLNVLQNSSVQLNLNKSKNIPRLPNDPITGIVQDYLGLRRVSTTPANLCYHSPLMAGPVNPFSLEV